MDNHEFKQRIVDYALNPVNFDDFSDILSKVLPSYTKLNWGHDAPYKKHFNVWQAAGFTLLPNHYYSPIPDLNQTSDEKLQKLLPLECMDMNISGQLQLIKHLSDYKSEYMSFIDRGPDYDGFRFGVSFGRVDAEFLYAMVRHLKPKNFIEIGSGMSTLIIAEACVKNESEGFHCNFHSIDPYPSSVLNKPINGVTQLHKSMLEDIPLSFFEQLGDGDILFIDSSHVIRPGSDVEYEYFHLLPKISKGVYIHIHDIFLPEQYPLNWVKNEKIFWNEQYILAMFMFFNNSFQVSLANSFLCSNYSVELNLAIPDPAEKSGAGSFWIKRIN